MKKKVLVVEDQLDMLMGLKDNLEFEGYEVITAVDGLKGLEIARTEKPDLIILDWMMPEMSGIDICKQLKSDPELNHIHIFMLTAKGQDADEHMGFQCGVERYITKPFSPKSLLEMVQETIGKDNS